MFIHKYEARLAKDISTLQAEVQMLEPGERNQHNEDREHVKGELALLKKLAAMIEQYNQKRMREVVDRMAKNYGTRRQR
jgi:hypothetical protein